MKDKSNRRERLREREHWQEHSQSTGTRPASNHGVPTILSARSLENSLPCVADGRCLLALIAVRSCAGPGREYSHAAAVQLQSLRRREWWHALQRDYSGHLFSHDRALLARSYRSLSRSLRQLSLTMPRSLMTPLCLPEWLRYVQPGGWPREGHGPCPPFAAWRCRHSRWRLTAGGWRPPRWRSLLLCQNQPPGRHDGDVVGTLIRCWFDAGPCRPGVKPASVQRPHLPWSPPQDAADAEEYSAIVLKQRRITIQHSSNHLLSPGLHETADGSSIATATWNTVSMCVAFKSKREWFLK